MSNVKYSLMNKNRVVLDFLYDIETHHVVKILAVHDSQYAPPAVIDVKGNITRAALDSWWQHRSIPASRAQLKQLMETLDINTTLALAEKSFGLSLSDRYWINDPSHPQEWSGINFFDNAFTDDLGILTLGQDSSTQDPNLMSPNSTVGGDLSKKWTIVDGQRLLVKSGSGFANQEVYNEVIATRLHQRLLSEDDYIPYMLHYEGHRTYCACANMLQEDEELIPALHIIRNRKKPNSQNDYQFLVSCFENLGLKGVQTYLSKMFVCDFIVGNFDRHYQNFGVIRNVETLEYTRFAPIFDTGNSLWCNTQSLDTYKDYEYIAKPFGRNGLSPSRQLELLSDFSWFHPDKLDGFTNEVEALLRLNPNMPQSRIERIITGISRQIEQVNKHITKYEQTKNRSLSLSNEVNTMRAASKQLSKDALIQHNDLER